MLNKTHTYAFSLNAHMLSVNLCNLYVYILDELIYIDRATKNRHVVTLHTTWVHILLVSICHIYELATVLDINTYMIGHVI